MVTTAKRDYRLVPTAKYSYRQVSNAVCEVLREAGEYHVQRNNCYYDDLEPDRPMCFIGTVFAKLDSRLLDVIKDSGKGYVGLARLRDTGVLGGGLFAPAVWEALYRSQWVADSHGDWGYAADVFQQTYKQEAYSRG